MEEKRRGGQPCDYSWLAQSCSTRDYQCPMSRLFQNRLLASDGRESPVLFPIHHVFLRCHFRGVKLPSNTDKIILEKLYFISVNQQSVWAFHM